MHTERSATLSVVITMKEEGAIDVNHILGHFYGAKYALDFAEHHINRVVNIPVVKFELGTTYETHTFFVRYILTD